MVEHIKKNFLCEIIISAFILLSIIALIILVKLINAKRPKKFKEFTVNDITITALESFDFIDYNEIPEYPNDHLGLTGNLIINCTTGTCIKEIYHEIIDFYCDSDGENCGTVDDSWTEYRKIIDYNCSQQCFNNTKYYCECIEPYQVEGTCERKDNDIYQSGKVCYADNVIYFWKGKKIYNVKTSNFSYLEDVNLKEEECSKGTKFCGILDNDEKKLCIEEKKTCPINYLSENKLNNNYSSVIIGNKTFYYGNDDTIDRKIFSGLIADTDLYLNNTYEKEIIDNYTIQEFLEENKNLYKGVNLGYDPYNYNNINSKGKSHLNIFYNNQNIDLENLRQKKQEQIFNQSMNYKYLNSIHYNTNIILILGLIALGFSFLVFFIFIGNQILSYIGGIYDCKCKKYIYGVPIVIILIIFISPLIFGCKNIKKAKNAEKFDHINNYSTFKNLNIAFIALGFTLFALLIVYIVIFPIKWFKEKPKIDNNITNKITHENNNLSSANINNNDNNNNNQ